MTLTTEQGDDSACEHDANHQVLKVAKSESGIARHRRLPANAETSVVCRSSITSRFKVIAWARNASHLGFLEALFILDGTHLNSVQRKSLFVLQGCFGVKRFR